MTPDEKTLLTQFLNDLAQTRGVTKDLEAAQMIDAAVRANPDAAYVLTQHALMADQALHQAQARIAELEAQSRAAEPAPSFFGARGASPQYAPYPPQGQPQAAPQTPWAAAAAPPPPYSGGGGLFGGGGGLGSFLRTAGTTAAGVAGGEMLFSGLSNIFGGGHQGFGGGGFGGGGFGGGFGGPEVENVTVNNYGDDGGDDDGGSSGDDYN